MFARSPSPSQRPAPTTIASLPPIPLGLCSCSTSLSKMGTQAVARDRGVQEEMGTYPRHVLHFSRNLFLRQFNLFPKNQYFDPSCFHPLRTIGMSTRRLTLFFDRVITTYFRPPDRNIGGPKGPRALEETGAHGFGQ